jgi:hypothetical protein
MKIIIVSLCLLTVLICTVSFSNASYTWSNSVLDGRGSCGKYISAAVLPTGNFGVSFFSNGRLRYAQSHLDINNDVKWDMLDVDRYGIVGMFTSLVVRPSGRPSIAYYDQEKGNLKMARRNGDSWNSTWTIDVVDMGNDAGMHASMAIAPDGNESIAYLRIAPGDGNASLMYTHAVGTQWFTEVVPVTGIDKDSNLSLAFAPDGLPAIVYHQNVPSVPVYVKCESNMSWTLQVIDSTMSGGKDPSIIFLPNGSPAVSYQVEYNPATGTYNDLRYAHFDGTQWIHEDVDYGDGIYSNLGYFSSLKLNAAGKPTIAYYELDKTSVRYAYQVADEWKFEVVQVAGLVGPYTTLIYGLDDLPVVFYYNMGWTQLTWARSVPDQIPEMNITGNGLAILDGDTTPSLDDKTDFGSVDVFSGIASSVFTIENTGSAALTLTGNPKVQISGINAADFTVIVQPVSPITIGNSTTFEVMFDPSAKALRIATISISNNDSDENPYNFNICGTGRIIEPEMDVKGNNFSIQDGDTTPSLSDYTDFGSIDVTGGEIIKTFTIENTGNGPLNLTGNPRIQIDGANAADFIVLTQPDSPVPLGGNAIFQIQFRPGAKGIRNAIITIPSDDSDENPYDFSICGKGLPTFDVAIREIFIAGDGTKDVLIRFDAASGYRFDMYYSDSPPNIIPEWTLAEMDINPSVEWRDNGDSRTGNIHPSQVHIRRYQIIGYTQTNILYLIPTNESGYIKPTDNITTNLFVSNLQQMVKACQTFVGYDSTYFSVISVVPGDNGVWDDLVWGVYTVPGEIDAAIGVYGESSPSQGTQENGIIAKFILTSKGVEGVTRIVFRPNLNPDPFLIGSTYLSDMSAFPVWPSKVNSSSIYIDGTAPTVNIASAKQGSSELLISLGSTTKAIVGIVNIRVTAADVASAGMCNLNGVPTITVIPFNGTAESATYVNQSPISTYNYVWQITNATPNGAVNIFSNVADKAGNSASDSDTIYIQKM